MKVLWNWCNQPGWSERRRALSGATRHRQKPSKAVTRFEERGAAPRRVEQQPLERGERGRGRACPVEVVTQRAAQLREGEGSKARDGRGCGQGCVHEETTRQPLYDTG